MHSYISTKLNLDLNLTITNGKESITFSLSIFDNLNSVLFYEQPYHVQAS